MVRPNGNRDNWAKKWHEEMEQPCFESPRRQKNRIVVNTISRILEFPLCSELHLGQTAPDIQRGGRKQAYAMLESFLYPRGFDYRTQMSSPLTAYDACSRISPHLTYGTMSIEKSINAIAFPLCFHKKKSISKTKIVGILYLKTSLARSFYAN